MSASDSERQNSELSLSPHAPIDPEQSVTSFRSRLERFNYTPSPEKEKKTRSNTTMPPTTRSATLAKPSLDEILSPSAAAKTQKITPLRKTAKSESGGSDGGSTSSRKRRIDDIGSPLSVSSATKRRSTTKERSARDPYSPTNKLVDSLDDNLILVFVGLNPGLQTAATGHAYSHASNLFWKILHSSGITPKRHIPADTYALVDLYRIGNTNLCVRPTRAGDGLTQAEQEEGVGIVDAKITKFKPEAVCIVGKGIWETMFKVKRGRKLKREEFQWGWQDESMWLGREMDEQGNLIWPGAKTFVTTSTSGLAASMNPAEKLEVWKPLGDWVREKRANMNSTSGGEPATDAPAED